MEKLIDETEIGDIVKDAINDGKFKIYKIIHNRFERVNFEIEKK